MSAQMRMANLTKSYPSPRGTVTALDGMSLVVRADEFVCLVGPSGCGKTTLLRLVAGLLDPTEGRVTFEDWPQAPRAAMVFQDPGLFPWLSVLDNVAFGLETQGMARSERRAMALEMLGQVGLEAFAAHYPHELSGGMRQKAAIARALVVEPDILLMDEPFRALDAQTRLVLQEDLRRLVEQRPRMVLFVTHDIEEAILLGDRLLVLSGRPARVVKEIVVPLGRPRRLTNGNHPDIEELRWEIWRLLKPEIHGLSEDGRAST